MNSGEVTAANACVEELLGYTVADMIGKTLWDLTPFAAIAATPEAFRDMHREEYRRYNIPLETKDGQTNVAECVCAAYVVDGQKVLQCNIRDITSRTRADARLRLQGAALEAAASAIVITNRAGVIEWANSAFSALTGYTVAEAVGKNPGEFLKSDQHHPAFYEALWSTILSGQVWRGEMINRRKDGSLYREDQTITPVRDAQGAISHFIAVKQDSTERERLDIALQSSEERMRFALEAAGVGIWDLDHITGVLRFSKGVEAQYGLPPGAFDGTLEAMFALTHPDDREFLAVAVANAMRSGGDFTLKARTIWPDGTVHWLEGVGREYHGVDGQPLRATGISRDVTERHALEQQYQHAQKMEAIGRLAGGVAHDFNNLLTVILGYGQLLASELGSDDPRQADVAEIEKAGRSAAALTRQLLAFSRKQIIEPTRLNLNALVTNLRDMIGRLVGEDLSVVLKLSPDLAFVIADGGQLEQVVMNLAVNARDAMPRGGTLTIETANVELDEHYATLHVGVSPGPYVALTVTDTGTGITADVQARLFEPFFTTKEPGKGTGLGLATVHGIVTRGGGTVNVYSELGRGTAFTVYLPQATTAATVPDAPLSAPRLHVRAHTVLVVEDAAPLRELTRRLLETQGHTVRSPQALVTPSSSLNATRRLTWS